MESTQNNIFKIVVVGASAVGKSSIVERLVSGTFTDNLTSTCGADYFHYQTTINEKKVKLQIWDTAGQERYRSISKSYFRNAVGALLVYDITNEDSFTELVDWLNDLQSLCSPNAYILLIGNKSDLEKNRKVSTEQVDQFAQRHALESILTSAQSGDNIEFAFEKLASELLVRSTNGEISNGPSPAPTLVAETEQKGGYCC